jgi:hypothetical protein
MESPGAEHKRFGFRRVLKTARVQNDLAYALAAWSHK